MLREESAANLSVAVFEKRRQETPLPTLLENCERLWPATRLSWTAGDPGLGLRARQACAAGLAPFAPASLVGASRRTG
jgi:hypothetical protein